MKPNGMVQMIRSRMFSTLRAHLRRFLLLHQSVRVVVAIQLVVRRHAVVVLRVIFSILLHSATDSLDSRPGFAMLGVRRAGPEPRPC